MLNPPSEETLLDLRVGVDLHDKCSAGWQRRLIFGHSPTRA
jgi:hypothetical protein